jgi:hypothetical protein
MRESVMIYRNVVATADVGFLKLRLLSSREEKASSTTRSTESHQSEQHNKREDTCWRHYSLPHRQALKQEERSQLIAQPSFRRRWVFVCELATTHHHHH